MNAFVRASGFGIRDYELILPLSSCLSETARRMAIERGSNYIWHPHGCDLLETDLEYFIKQVKAITEHPNISHLILLTMKCGPVNAKDFPQADILNYHDFMDERKMLEAAHDIPRHFAKAVSVPGPLTIGVKCGGSTPDVINIVNPAMGAYCDHLIDQGGTVIIGENWEFMGAIDELANRTVNQVAQAAVRVMGKKLLSEFVKRYPGRKIPIYSSQFSLGRFRKAGSKPIQGVLQVTDKPSRPGLWILDGPNADMAGMSALAMSGCHAIFYATGLGLPMGNALCPVFPWTPQKMGVDFEDCKAERDRHFEWQFHLKNMVW